MAEYQYSREEITTDARARHWNIFKPDWEYLRSYPALSLCSLVGLSVGLHPWFSRPDWVFHCAKPYFEGQRDSELDEPTTEDDQSRAEDLQRFLKRIHIAAGNLAPAGTLNPIDGIAQGEATFVNVAEFLAFAGRLGWDLPEEFKRFQGGDTAPSKTTNTTQTQNKTKILKPKARDKTESLLLIYSYFEWKGLNPGDTVDIPAKKAWGEIHAGKFETDLIKTRTGDRKNARIIMNGGEEMDFQEFAKKYNSRLKSTG